jgi:hypothetical protein
MVWIEVLDENKRHTRIEREMFQQLRERIKSTGRSSDGDHRK